MPLKVVAEFWGAAKASVTLLPLELLVTSDPLPPESDATVWLVPSRSSVAELVSTSALPPGNWPAPTICRVPALMTVGPP